jgi:DNA-binding XRE family transcriptional regulator
LQTLREHRRRALLSQRRLADLAGTSQRTIHGWETGRNKPTWYDIIAEVCAVLDVKPEEVTEFHDALSKEETA